jgi:hypothetical protein
MDEGFSDDPVTRWLDTEYRIMELLEDFYYIDPDGKQWDAPKGSLINGATIPEPLWSTIGSPYVGCYRRASIVHDVGVGELNNPPVTHDQRKEADMMFYHACLYDGCSNEKAMILLAGVQIGTAVSLFSNLFSMACSGNDDFSRLSSVNESSESVYIRLKFQEIINDPESIIAIKEKDIYLFEKVIDRKLGRNDLKQEESMAI